MNIVSQLDIYYGIRPDLQELSICSAASIADWALDAGYAVGLYTNTLMYMPDEEVTTALPEKMKEGSEEHASPALLQRRRIRLPAASNKDQRKRIMEVLARIQSFFGSSIEDVLQTERTRLPAGTTVVVITSTISEQLIDILSHIRQGGHSVTILFVGDNPPPIKLAGIIIYHLGGVTTWKTLVDVYSRASDTQESSVQATPGFQL